MVFKTDYCLMQVKSIAECSKGSILQYFRSSLSYHLPLKPLLCLFLVVLLYMYLTWRAEDMLPYDLNFYTHKNKCNISPNLVEAELPLVLV